jgi:hypothetical protein
VLYHLTDVDALLGIASNRCLWACLATTLNDALEVRHGVDLAVDILRERLSREVTEYDSALLAYLIDPTSAPKEVQFEMLPLVVSFCKRINKSGQWLHYGRSGRGVAIGFASSMAATVKYDLVEVDYRIESQRERMLRLLQVGSAALEKDLQNVPPEQKVAIARRTAHIVAIHVPLLAVQMKHPSFAEEEEWRMFAHYMSLNGERLEKGDQRREIKFRKSGERVVPYEELSFGGDGPLPIKEVVLGQMSPISTDAARLLLLESGTDVAVKRSDVPVR